VFWVINGVIMGRRLFNGGEVISKVMELVWMNVFRKWGVVCCGERVGREKECECFVRLEEMRGVFVGV